MRDWPVNKCISQEFKILIALQRIFDPNAPCHMYIDDRGTSGGQQGNMMLSQMIFEDDNVE